MLRTANPVVLFILGATAQYGGAAIAVSLFHRVSPVGVAWLRAAAAAALLWGVQRPKPWTWSRARLTDTAVFGLFLVAMNTAFYVAIDSLPLGTAVAIEFIGPITVGIFGYRTRRNLGALALAGCGVALLAGVEVDANPSGLAWILLAAGFWGGYILWGKRTSSKGTDGLPVALAIGVAAFAPLSGTQTGPVWGSPWLLLLVAGVGLLSSAVPYGIDQIVLSRVDQTQFAILLAILPATAAVIGAMALRQIPSPVEVIGMLAVIGAVLVRDRDPAPLTAIPGDS